MLASTSIFSIQDGGNTMRIKGFAVAVVAIVLSSYTMADQIADEHAGLQLCKDQINQQFTGVDRVRLRDKYFVDVSESSQKRTYYMNGRHWEQGRWYNDRILCVTDLNNRRVVDLEKAIGKYVIQAVPVQVFAGKN
jgi:hypothetical protein